MALTWTLEDIQAKVRKLTGKRETGQITVNALIDKINDYYQNIFPVEVKPEKLKGWFTQETAVSDSGQYTVSADVLLLEYPAWVNGQDVTLYNEPTEFFKKYPKDTGSPYCVTDPGLVIGTSSKKAVKYSAFTYNINTYSYSGAAGEMALSGDTIPQNKYGAWRIGINSSGTVSLTAATSNGDGYDTPGRAVFALTNESSDLACMGFVTAMSTGAGGFVPGTTDLDASGVTASFTDGFHSTRNTPKDLLYDGGILYAGPKADDIYQIKIRQITKPSALTEGVAVTVPEWGPVVAYGTAIDMFEEERNFNAAKELAPIYAHLLTLINRKKLIQKTRSQRAKPRF